MNSAIIAGVFVVATSLALGRRREAEKIPEPGTVAREENPAEELRAAA